MKANAAIKRIGGLRKAKSFAKTVADKYGVKIDICRHGNEEEPGDNFLNVLFEYENYRKFCVAYDKMEEWLNAYGLHLTYECCGDGDGIIESYRIR